MSTSRLQKRVGQILRHSFGSHGVEENIRPAWLLSQTGARLELDFYLPELRIALEVQGEQHLQFCEHFHKTPQGFLDQLARDREKRELCALHDVTLWLIFTDTEADHIVGALTESPRLRYGILRELSRTAHAYASDFAALKTMQLATREKIVRGMQKFIRKRGDSFSAEERKQHEKSLAGHIKHTNKLKQQCDKEYDLKLREFWATAVPLVINGIRENVRNLYRIAGVHV